MTDDTDATDEGDRQWTEIEPTVGAFRIGHTNGSLCYLIDDEGRPRSEGYHEIWAERVSAGPPGNVHYYGQRGASEGLISPIPDTYIKDDG